MNQGRIEEIADADTLYANPQKKIYKDANWGDPTGSISLTDAKTGHGKWPSPSKCSILLKTRIKVSKIVLGQTLM
jgi:hypothetical protein